MAKVVSGDSAQQQVRTSAGPEPTLTPASEALLATVRKSAREQPSGCLAAALLQLDGLLEQHLAAIEAEARAQADAEMAALRAFAKRIVHMGSCSQMHHEHLVAEAMRVLAALRVAA